MVKVAIKVTKQRRDNLGRFAAYLRNPFTKKLREKTKEKLIYNFRHHPYTWSPNTPYHTYPNWTGELEATSFVKPSGNSSILIGSTSQHASFLEEGREPLDKGLMIFKGYYPNNALLLRSLMPKRLVGKKIPFARRQVIAAVAEQIRLMSVTPAGSKLRVQAVGKGVMSKISAKRYARSVGVDLNAPVFDKSGKPYRYGIFTVFAHRVRAIPRYSVFTQTAEWAKKEIVTNIKKQAAKVSRMG